jgi:hypothetical protein
MQDDTSNVPAKGAGGNSGKSVEPGSSPSASSAQQKQGGVIKAISGSSVHRICSGQVILDPSSALKELVENSVDSGCTKLDVKLKEYGLEGVCM